jgi:hypothetical protein
MSNVDGPERVRLSKSGSGVSGLWALADHASRESALATILIESTSVKRRFARPETEATSRKAADVN